MTNTIPNVPRELLENLIEQHITAHGCTTETARQAQLILCAPSPAGVDGCRCSMSISMLGDGCRYCQPQEYIDRLSEMLDEERAELSDAQAIIDGLRGENEALHAQVKVLQSGANSWQSGYDEGRRMGGKHCALTIDQQAQLIGELEGLLMDVAGMFHGPGIEGGPLTKLRRRIDAALSAGKEKQ